MNWTSIDVTKDHQAATGRYDVVRSLEGSIPWVEETADVYYKKERSLDVLEQFVVRCLVELDPVGSVEEISEILGLGDDRFVAPTVDDLNRMDLIKINDYGYHVTEELEKANDEGVWIDQYNHTITCSSNPFTGRRYDGRPPFLNEGHELEVDALPSSELGRQEFEQWVVGDAGPLHGADVTRVEFRNRSVLWQPFHLLILEDHHDDTWGWEPYDPSKGEVVASYRYACQFLGATEAAHDLLVESPSGDEAIVAPSAAADDQTVQAENVPDRTLAQQEFVRRYGTREAADRINETIGGAKEEVLISFPWIKGPALTSDLLEVLTEALQAGVFLYVGYGIGQSAEGEDSHPDAIERLRSLDQNTEGVSRVVWTGTSHVKEIVVDRNEYMGGSFNRLSFRGDPDQETGTVRRESMIHTNCQEVIENSVREFVPILRNAVASQIQLGSIQAYSVWRKAWRPLFRLGPRPEDVRMALSTLPSTGRKVVSAVDEILTQYQLGGGVTPKTVLNAVLDALNENSPNLSRTASNDFEDILMGFCDEWDLDIEVLNDDTT